MRGNVIIYDETLNCGEISGRDGCRYNFTRQDWTGSNPPAVGLEVDFVEYENTAKGIVAMRSLTGQPKSRIAFILLSCHIFWWVWNS